MLNILGVPIYVAFVLEQDNGDDWWIDDFTHGTSFPDPCLQAANISATDITATGATISWDSDSVGAAFAWCVEIGPPGHVPLCPYTPGLLLSCSYQPQGAMDGITYTNSYDLTEIGENQTYEIYVFSTCGTIYVDDEDGCPTYESGEGRGSFYAEYNWAGPFSFTTPVHPCHNSGLDVITACDDYTWIDGVTYTASNNTATHTIDNAAGCDSTVTLDLTLNNSNTGLAVITACDDYTWIDGVTYTASNNTATHTLPNSLGCDSIVTLNLTINYSHTVANVVTACDSYNWYGVTYTESNNTATNVFPGAISGCDLVLALDLTINNSTSATDVVNTCDSYTWMDGVTYTASNNTATHTIDNAAGCDSIVTLDLTVITQWSGAVSSEWNNPANWCPNGVPTSAEDVIIGVESNNPHITLASPGITVNDLTIESGANLTVDAGKALTVNGDLANEGTVVVKADATGIGSLITNGAVAGSGSFNMEQYLDGSGGATPDGLFWYVGSPVVGAPASTYDIASGNRLWRADESTQSYPGVTNGTTTLNQGQGYVSRMGATGTIIQTGTGYNTGAVNITGLTRTGTTETNRGYNLVSNPYPSTVSWDGATRSDLFPTVWYRTHQGSQMLYDTYNAASLVGTNNNGAGSVTGDIAPTQAFWVRVPTDGLTGSLTFDNSLRSHGTMTGILRLASSEGLVRMTLSNEVNSDETIVLFNEEAEDVFDSYDSHKFWASLSIPQVYTTTGSDTLVINGLTNTVNNPVVDLGIKLPAVGDYTFDATSITLTGETVHLEDRLLGIFQELNSNPEYDFTSSVSGNIPTRFALHFGMSITGIEDQGITTRVYASESTVTILTEGTTTGVVEVMDVSGKLVSRSNLSATRTDMELMVQSGIYLVRVTTEGGVATHKVFLK